MSVPRAVLIAIACLCAVIAGWVMVARYQPRAYPVAPPPAPAVPAPTAEQRALWRIDAARLQRDVQTLAGAIGVRTAGSAAELRAAAYVKQQLSAAGYRPRAVPVPLPRGRQSVNVLAELPGASDRTVLIGAHLDSKAPAPGANDNASGVATLLELARVLRETRPPYRVLFVAFGAEERIDRQRDHHHYGSRLLAADATLRTQLVAMISLDMVGYGSVLHIDNQGWAADGWRDRLAVIAKGQGLPVRTGRSRPWSDHEAFERRGVPVAYLHWERDPTYHRRGDRPEHVQPGRMRQTAGVMVRGMLREK